MESKEMFAQRAAAEQLLQREFESSKEKLHKEKQRQRSSGEKIKIIIRSAISEKSARSMRRKRN